jgi:hypothetical protein
MLHPKPTGVGPLVALTYTTGVDEPERFRNARTVGAHFGLTPRRFQSGEVDWSGGISRAGSSPSALPSSQCFDPSQQGMVRLEVLGGCVLRSAGAWVKSRLHWSPAPFELGRGGCRGPRGPLGNGVGWSALHFFGRPCRMARDQDAANKEAPLGSCPYPILSRFCPSS